MVKIKLSGNGRSAARRRMTAVISAVAVAAALMTGCGQTQEEETQSPVQTEEQSITPQEQAEADETGEQTNLENSALVGNDGEHSFLTGEPEDAGEVDERPLAVMFNNIKEGCPQTGIEHAAIVYEAPVEGRITRLMGLFEDYEELDRIGYIRSSRDYFVYCALEYDAIYAHFGQATPYVGDLINSDRVDNISGAVAGIDHPATSTFFRTSERKAPNNVYIDVKGLMKDIDRFGYSLTYHDTHKAKFSFAADGQEAENAWTGNATVLYPGGKENNLENGYSRVEARFEYNAEDGKYYRYQYGGPQIDESTGDQLAYDNVIFQYCHGEVRDDNDYLAFELHGDNGMKVQVFTGGKMTEGTWSRYSDNDPAYYVDSEGNPIMLNQGKTWICLIWEDYADDVVIE
ncbi:MAG TPA: DUF3048 domain-containing protein [Candidatus Eisenbergiella merdipullorum]|uniref:DUF3048 domain-containing protein n=1 Tax=Candidatus Eisenbergiella merdipullorum TaxID=2838553 RepID=A0A9D2KZH2_9FIRM|nr:DUF3048 domain-containing protein [Candidatus Eisenbergiella merdipullorum]